MPRNKMSDLTDAKVYNTILNILWYVLSQYYPPTSIYFGFVLIESSRHCPFQTIRARTLTFWENVHPPQCITCHLSGVQCQVSSVIIFIIFFTNVGASLWRVCYQRGIRCLVLKEIIIIKIIIKFLASV